MILTRRAILARIESGHIVSPPELVQENSVNMDAGTVDVQVVDAWMETFND